jgi:hypothetical protein
VDESLNLDAVAAATERILGPLDQPHAGLLVAMPVLKVWGLRKNGG